MLNYKTSAIWAKIICKDQCKAITQDIEVLLKITIKSLKLGQVAIEEYNLSFLSI